MPLNEDLTVLFQTADFATAVTYKAGGVGGGVTVNVLFDVPDETRMGIAGANPSVQIKASDVPSFSNADTLTIAGVVYRCINEEPLDDGAILRIQLEKQ
jgi:hypothetical protein